MVIYFVWFDARKKNTEISLGVSLNAYLNRCHCGFDRPAYECFNMKLAPCEGNKLPLESLMRTNTM